MRIFTSLFVVAAVALVGCTGDLVEIGPGGNSDMSFSAGGGGGGGGGGSPGGEMGVNAIKFFPDIQMGLDSEGCSISGCHGGSQIPVIKMGATAQADIDANYMHVMAEINTTAPDQSPLLTKPLNGSGVTHSGTKPFMTTQDMTYQKWLNWIKAGAPKQ